MLSLRASHVSTSQDKAHRYMLVNLFWLRASTVGFQTDSVLKISWRRRRQENPTTSVTYDYSLRVLVYKYYDKVRLRKKNSTYLYDKEVNYL